LWFKASLGKKFMRYHLKKKKKKKQKLGVVMHAFYPSYMRSISRRHLFHAIPLISARPYLKNTHGKKRA
jgi:hypothetical protein